MRLLYAQHGQQYHLALAIPKFCSVLLHLHGLQMSNLLRCIIMPYLPVDTLSTSHQVCVPSVCVQPLDHTAPLGVVHMLRISFYFPLQTALAAPQNDPCDCER